MLEVFEVILKIVLLLGLFGIAWFDYRTKLIDIRWLWIIGLIGLLLGFGKCGVVVMLECVKGMLPGAMLLLFAWVSSESIGFGDGWLFVVTGIFLGFQKNMLLLFVSLMAAGMFAIVCLVLKRKKKSDRVALAPFVLVAYVGVCL